MRESPQVARFNRTTWTWTASGQSYANASAWKSTARIKGSRSSWPAAVDGAPIRSARHIRGVGDSSSRLPLSPADPAIGDQVEGSDVDEHLVTVDANDFALHDIAVFKRDEGCLVVRDDLAVDFKQQSIGSRNFDADGSGCFNDGC